MADGVTWCKFRIDRKTIEALGPTAMAGFASLAGQEMTVGWGDREAEATVDEIDVLGETVEVTLAIRGEAPQGAGWRSLGWTSPTDE